MGKEFRNPLSSGLIGAVISRLLMISRGGRHAAAGTSTITMHNDVVLINSLLFVFGLSIGIVFTSTFSFTNTTLLLPAPEPATVNGGIVPEYSNYYNINHNYSNYNNNNNNIVITKHNMSDKELFWRASMIPERRGNYNGDYGRKLAFMFLTPGPIPLAPLWEKFFKGHEGYYTIYVHSHPLYNDTLILPQTSVFYGRRIPSQEVSWGSISMVDAEKRLLANALLDSSNQRFILLSDSCIPLFNFTTIYNYLINSNKKISFLSSFDDPRSAGRGRYNPKMWPTITLDQWRKGSQWFEIHRNLAIRIVSDVKYYNLFKQYCLPPCYNDEHYFPTLVNIMYPEMSCNRSITWIDWSRGGPHPRKYGWEDISDELLNQIRFGSSSSKCLSNYGNNNSVNCFLFARKFLPSSIEQLLKVAPLLLDFDP